MSEIDAWAIQNSLSRMSDERLPTAEESFRRLMGQCRNAYNEYVGRGRADGPELMDRAATPF